jgi:hypothetical protein
LLLLLLLLLTDRCHVLSNGVVIKHVASALDAIVVQTKLWPPSTRPRDRPTNGPNAVEWVGYDGTTDDICTMHAP